MSENDHMNERLRAAARRGTAPPPAADEAEPAVAEHGSADQGARAPALQPQTFNLQRAVRAWRHGNDYADEP